MTTQTNQTMTTQTNQTMATQTNQTKHPEPVRIAKAWKLCQQGWSLETIKQLLELSPHNPKLFAIECVEKVKHVYNDSNFVKKHPEYAEAANNAIRAAKGNNKEEQQKAVEAVYAAYSAGCDSTDSCITNAIYAGWAALRSTFANNSVFYAAHAAYAAIYSDPNQKAWQLQRLMQYMLDEVK